MFFKRRMGEEAEPLESREPGKRLKRTAGLKYSVHPKNGAFDFKGVKKPSGFERLPISSILTRLRTIDRPWVAG